MEIENHIKQSLTAAGIGSIFHNRRLSDAGTEGSALAGWLRKVGGDAFRNEGRSLIMEGFSRTSVILLARGLHINGYGVRLVSLTQLMTFRKFGGERWEDIVDCMGLFLLPAQTEKPNPLNPWQQDEIEAFLSERMLNGKSVIMCMDERSPETPWWSEGYLNTMAQCGRTLTSTKQWRKEYAEQEA